MQDGAEVRPTLAMMRVHCAGQSFAFAASAVPADRYVSAYGNIEVGSVA